ncbi:hypothetical protein KQX54_019596 [Cotesia glomerata]|uniref:Uncharacterized protein n=1 Tax=Cotesia glomerata TaxID=32391 RepID=A0AAV7I2G1_COTGL|nr:hypothetical protein KQX54_019596 [Cotesia glomerata]
MRESSHSHWVPTPFPSINGNARASEAPPTSKLAGVLVLPGAAVCCRNGRHATVKLPLVARDVQRLTVFPALHTSNGVPNVRRARVSEDAESRPRNANRDKERVVRVIEVRQRGTVKTDREGGVILADQSYDPALTLTITLTPVHHRHSTCTHFLSG